MKNDNENSNVSFWQFTIGSRFYSKEKNSFIDAGLGYYNINNDKDIGVNVGVGGKVNFSESYAILISGRLNCADVFKSPILYYSLLAGIEVNNKKNIPSAESNSKVSIAGLAGTYGNILSSNNSYSFSGEISYNVNNRLSLVLNYLYSKLVTEVSYPDLYSPTTEKQNNLAGGVRFFITGGNIKLFLETLAGVYMTSSDRYTDPPILYSFVYNYDKNYFGFTYGAGAELRLIDNLSGLFKFDQNSQLNGDSFSGISGGLKYSL